MHPAYGGILASVRHPCGRGGRLSTLCAPQAPHKRRSDLDQGRLRVWSRIRLVAETPELKLAQDEAEGGTLGTLVK